MSVLIYCSFKGENGDLKIVYKCPLFYIVVKIEDDDLKNIFKCPSKFVGYTFDLKYQLLKRLSGRPQSFSFAEKWYYEPKFASSIPLRS